MKILKTNMLVEYKLIFFISYKINTQILINFKNKNDLNFLNLKLINVR